MLELPIEEDWKIDTEKRFEKFIFRTIDTSTKIENKSDNDKIKEKKIVTSMTISEKINEKFQLEKKIKKGLSLDSKMKNEENKNEETLYELIALSQNEILLQKKKIRQVKQFSNF